MGWIEEWWVFEEVEVCWIKWNYKLLLSEIQWSLTWEWNTCMHVIGSCRCCGCRGSNRRRTRLRNHIRRAGSSGKSSCGPWLGVDTGRSFFCPPVDLQGNSKKVQGFFGHIASLNSKAFIQFQCEFKTFWNFY